MAVIKSEYLLPNYDPEEVGMKGEKGDDGKTSYVHIAYSNSSDGGVDFSTTDPTNRAYTGYYTDFEMIDSTDPSKYEWQRTKGDSGKDGVAGKDGVGLQSTSITYAKHTNASTPPSAGWQAEVPTVPAGQYLWTKTVWNYTDSSSETGYSVARMGQDGAKGNDGIAGKDGVGIKTTLIEYVVSTSGTVRPTSGWSATIPTVPPGQYLWTRTTWTYTDNTTEQGYSVARQGEKGDKGDKGVPGTPGADGRTPYFHTAYAWSAEGNDRFTPVYPTENILLNTSKVTTLAHWQDTVTLSKHPFYKNGTENIFRIDNPNTTANYAYTDWYPASSGEWTFSFKGFQNSALSSFDVYVFWRKEDPSQTGFIRVLGFEHFTVSELTTKESLLTLPEGTKDVYIRIDNNGSNTAGTTAELWFIEPVLRKGNMIGVPYTPAPSEDYANAYPTYTGTYTDYTEVDSTNPVDYTWVRAMGDDGVGISTTIIEYNTSTNSTTPPSTGWTSTIPSISGGQYLWTRVTLNYTDGKKAESYTVARQGEDGADGQLFTGETEPTDFNEGDIWYKVVSGKVTGVYEAKGGAWVEIPFESSVIAETIIGKTIQASHLTGSTIDGGSISGAEFLNEYANVTSGVNQVTDGKLGVKDGILQAGSTYYLTNSAGERLYKFATTEADIHQGTVNLRQRLYDEAGTQTSESTTSVSGGLISLSLTDDSGNYHGVLDAKALTKTPWINLTLGSAFETKEDNPCQYKIQHNLDGTRTVLFRGQFGLKSGNMVAGRDYYPFQVGSGTSASGTTTLPAAITPRVTEFAYGAIGVPSGANAGGRIGITRTPKIVFSPGSDATYCGISSLSYIID